jgi:nicotinamidase-related amidase
MTLTTEPTLPAGAPQHGEGTLLNLPCRYYRVYTDPDVPCIERNFQHVGHVLPVPLEQAALVLVDLWSTHYIDSWLRRAQEVTLTRILPLMQAAREAGLTVIHGPSPPVADRYVQAPPPVPGPPDPAPDWPPRGFRGIYRSGEYAPFGRDQEPRLSAALERYKTELDIFDPVKPLPGEPVIHTGPQLHGLLAERKILHLVYAGFATNWCMIGRDYGIIPMNGRGYNVILVRDATTGIEFHDTAEDLTATEIQIREIETKYGWSTTTGEFIEACAAGRRGKG